MAFRKVVRIGLPGEHRYNRGSEEEPLLYDEKGRQPIMQTKRGQQWSWFWTAVILTALAAACIGLGFGLDAWRRPLAYEPPLVLDDPVPILKRTTSLGRFMFSSPHTTVIVANNTEYTLQYPSDLTDYKGQTFTVYSNTSIEQKVVFDPTVNYAGQRCAQTTGPTWDKEGLYSVAKLTGKGCHIHWHVVSCGRIAVINAKCVEFCNVNLTECVVPVIESINVTSLFAGEAHVVNGTVETLNSNSASITTLVSESITSTTGLFVNLTSNVVTAVNGFITTLTSNLVMTNQTMNPVLAHTASGVIPPTHARQTLQFNGTVATGINQTAGLTLGSMAVGVFASQSGGLLGFTPTRGCWSVRDLVTADPLTSISDTGGIRVIQGGDANVFSTSDLSLDTQCPGNSQTISLEISSTSGSGGTLQIYLRYGTELGFDFVSVLKGGQLLFKGSGSGPNANDAFLEQTITTSITGADIVTVTYVKDSAAWSGNDILYFYATLAPSSTLSMTLPTDLTSYVGKDISVCTLDANPHTIASTGNYHLDPVGQWRVLQFQGTGSDACCAVFSVNTASEVSVKSRDPCTVFCSDDALSHCVDPLRPAETNLLHGTWKNRVKRTGDSYAIVDASTNPVSVRYHGGTVVTPTEQSTSESFYPIAFQVYASVNQTNLVDDDMNAPNVLRVQPGFRTFIKHEGLETQAGVTYASVFDKIDKIPPFLPTGTGSLNAALPPDHPEALFRNFVEKFIYNSHTSIGVDSLEEQWIGTLPALAYMEKIIKQGSGTISTPIIEARVTQAVNPEEITEFRFATYHRISPISRVVISGYDAGGSCAALNGDYLVCAANTNNIPLPSPAHEDYGPNPSARTVHHKMSVFLDSSAIPVLAGTTIANCTGVNNPVATVTYGPIDGASNYLQTAGAMYHWFYETVRVGFHFNIRGYFDETTATFRSNFAHPVEDWSQVAAILATGTTTVNAKPILSRHLDSTSAFYVNGASDQFNSRFSDLVNFAGVFADARVGYAINDYTGQYGIRPDQESSSVIFQTDNAARSTHYLSVPRHNYLEGVAYPAWKTIGTTRSGPLNLAAQSFYPGGEGDVFDVVMVPFGILPPADYSYMDNQALLNGGPASYPYEFEFNFVNDYNQESFFVGRIKPAYTGGLNIGYWRIRAEFNTDVASFCFTKEFCPYAHCANARDALTTMYTTITRYLLDDLACDHVIIDIRANAGGFDTQVASVRDLFGGDAQSPARSGWADQAGSGFGGGVNTYSNQFVFANNMVQEKNKVDDVDPTLTETNEPGSVLTNGQIAILDDTGAASSGDLFPNYFLGAAYDGQLGNNTQVTMVGSVDGRLVSCAVNHFLPFATEAPRFRDPDGNPASALRVRIDSECGRTVRQDGTFTNNRHLGLEIDLTDATGLAGGAPLWADWNELVYRDLGYTTNNRPVLPGWTGPQTPFSLVVTDPLSTTLGSNVVTVTMPGPHGFSTGDDVALGNAMLPVAATGGIPSVVLTGAQNITVTGANTFTFETSYYATYPGYFSPVATSTVAAGGGTFRVTNRNQWRDAWLEQSIKVVVAQAKKRGHVGRSPQERAERKERAQKLRAQRKAERESKRFDLHEANKRFKRNVGCPVGVSVVPIQQAPATINITMHSTREMEDMEREQETFRVRRLLTEKLMEGIHAGDLCLNTTGHLMAMTGAHMIPRIVFERKLRQESAQQKRHPRTTTYLECLKTCGDRTSPTYRQCSLRCGGGM